MKLRLSALTFAAVLCTATHTLAAPETWPRAIGLPGAIVPGADYCTLAGECHTAGSDWECHYTVAPKSDACWRILPAGSKCKPIRSCAATEAPGEPIPVTVVAQSARSGRVLLRLHGVDHSASEEGVWVRYKGVRMPLAHYNACNPAPGRSVTVTGSAAAEIICPP